MLLGLGARAPESLLRHANGFLDYFELGWWLRRHGFVGGRRVGSCVDLAAAVAAETRSASVLYLQFGGEDAAMVGMWAELLDGARTHLHVFEAATPHAGAWLPARGRGHFDASRNRVAAGPLDARVSQFDGGLNDRLREYEPPSAEALVAVFDTDYYPTTKLALDFVGERMPPTTFLFFDQLNHRADELRAFHEFLLETGMRFELFAANHELSCAVFRRVP